MSSRCKLRKKKEWYQHWICVLSGFSSCIAFIDYIFACCFPLQNGSKHPSPIPAWFWLVHAVDVCRKILSIEKRQSFWGGNVVGISQTFSLQGAFAFWGLVICRNLENRIFFAHKKTSIWVGELLERPIILWACSRSSLMAMSMAVVFPGEVLIYIYKYHGLFAVWHPIGYPVYCWNLGGPCFEQWIDIPNNQEMIEHLTDSQSMVR